MNHSQVQELSVTTTWFLVIGLIAIGVYDVIVGTKVGREATISYYMVAVSRQWPVIPLLLGIILGHIFWPQQPPLVSGFAGHLHSRSTDPGTVVDKR